MNIKKLMSFFIVVVLFTLSGCLDIKIPNFNQTAQPTATSTKNGDEATPTATPESTPEPTETPDNSEYTIDDIMDLLNSEAYKDENNFTVITDERMKEKIISAQLQQNFDAKVTTEFTYQTTDEGVIMKADIVSSTNGTTTTGEAYYMDGYSYESMLGYKYKYQCTEEEFLMTYHTLEPDNEEDEFKAEYIDSFTVEKEGRYTVIVLKLKKEAYFGEDEPEFDHLDELSTIMKIYLTEGDVVESVESIITTKGSQTEDDIEYSIDINTTIKVTVVDFKPIELPDDLDTYVEEDFEDITEFL